MAGLKRGAKEAGISEEPEKHRAKVSKTTTKNVAKDIPESAATTNGKPVAPLVSIPQEYGEVLVHGVNDFGQLGVERDLRRFPFPNETLADKEIVTVEAGLMHSLCINKDGKLYTCGQNDEGVLGRTGSEREYAVVESLRVPVARVSGGASHSACVDTQGNLYAWGCYRNAAGLFGKTGGSKKNLLGPDVPKLVKGVPKVRDVASGHHHTAAITMGNKIFTWGCGEGGTLGRIGGRQSSRASRMEESQLTPREIIFPYTAVQRANNVKPLHVSCGGYHNMCVMSDGSVYGWGLNNWGQLGVEMDEDEEEFVDLEKLKNVEYTPVLIETLSDLHVEEVVCGEQHTLLRTRDGHVYGCGRNSFHQLGQGQPKDPKALEGPNWKPVRIGGGLEHAKVTKLACKYHISFAVDAEGVAYSWGMGSTQALAANPDFEEQEDVTVPTKMHGGRLKDRKVLAMACGSMHALTLLKSKEASNEE